VKALVCWVKVLVLVTCITLVARAQECGCSGKVIDNFSGGDSAPLAWRYSTFQVRAGSPSEPTRICYKKVVANGSKVGVTNVSWEVADYFRRWIPANHTASACPVIAGEMKPAPGLGPLHHGVAAQPYSTTVREPSGGWKPQTGGVTTLDAPSRAQGQPKTLVDNRSEPLRSTIFFAVDANPNTPGAKIEFISEVVPASRGVVAKGGASQFQLMYYVHYQGPAALSFQLNTRVTAADVRAGPYLAPMPLLSNKPVKFGHSVSSISAESASLVVYNGDREIVLIESVGVYSDGSGKVWTPEAVFWKATGARP
jgi:hypothetical protein